MKLHNLFEKSTHTITDPRVAQALKGAGAKYKGRAEDEISAFILQTIDDQDEQDTELDSLDVYNHHQDDEIDHNEVTNVDQTAMLNDIMVRLGKLELGDMGESAEPITEASYDPKQGPELLTQKLLSINPEIFSQYGTEYVANIMHSILTLDGDIDELAKDTISWLEDPEYWEDETNTVKPKQVDEGLGDTVMRKMKVKTTSGKPNMKSAPKWAKFLGRTHEGAYHWLSNETPVEASNSDKYFPLAKKTEFTGFEEPGSTGEVIPVTMDEARGDSLGKKFNKMFWWDKYRTPKDMLAAVNKMSDEDLLSIQGSAGGWDDGHQAGEGTPRGFQIQIIDRELRRRGHRDFDKYMPDSEGIEEARGDSLGRKFNKWLYWDKDFTDPNKMKARVNKMSDEDLLDLVRVFPHEKKQADASATPRNVQLKMIKRELRRRGHRDFEKYMPESEDLTENANYNKWLKQNNPRAFDDAQEYQRAKKDYARYLRNKYKDNPANTEVQEAEGSSPVTDAQHNTMDRLIENGGKLYLNAKLVNSKGDIAYLGMNGKRKFAIYPDGTFNTGDKFVEFQRKDWKIELYTADIGK